MIEIGQVSYPASPNYKKYFASNLIAPENEKPYYLYLSLFGEWSKDDIGYFTNREDIERYLERIFCFCNKCGYVGAIEGHPCGYIPQILTGD